MADTETAAPLDAGSPASAEASVASSPVSDVGSSTDSRAIAAQLLGDTEDAAPAPQAADPDPSSQAPAAATSGDEADPVYQNLLASGSMPVDRHKAVLTNARRKAREEYEREVQAKYGWADQFDRPRAEQGLGLLQALDTDPQRTLRTLASALGVEFGAPPSPLPAGPEPMPEPDVQLADGSSFYSAPQLSKLMAWKDAQMEKRFESIESQTRPWRERAALAAMKESADQEAGSLLAEHRRDPEFVTLEPVIKTVMIKAPSVSFKDAVEVAKLIGQHQAQIRQQHETDRASQLSRKAAASSAPPSAPRAVTPLRDRDRSTADIAREVVLAADL